MHSNGDKLVMVQCPLISINEYCLGVEIATANYSKTSTKITLKICRKWQDFNQINLQYRKLEVHFDTGRK